MKSGEVTYYTTIMFWSERDTTLVKVCDKLCRTQQHTKLDQKANRRWHLEYQELKLHFITVVSMGVKTRSMITRVSIISITASSKDLLTSSLAMEDPFMRSLSNFKIYIKIIPFYTMSSLQIYALHLVFGNCK